MALELLDAPPMNAAHVTACAVLAPSIADQGVNLNSESAEEETFLQTLMVQRRLVYHPLVVERQNCR